MDHSSLRTQRYNATLVGLIEKTEYLRIFRVKPDSGDVGFTPGQYTTLGLGYWEPRVEGAPPEDLQQGQEQRMCRRAYSISHPILDGSSGTFVENGSLLYQEFYITLVDQANEPHLAPGLTPRLWMLAQGDRLHIGRRPTGHYSLEPVAETDDVILASTGTGEAPHNAMAWELLRRGHRGQIASIVCTRYRDDLAYLDKHMALADRFPNYHYFPLTTREPGQGNAKVYIQDLVSSGELEERLGHKLLPESAHFFLCGNPKMIGLPHRVGGELLYPKPMGMIELLEDRGFVTDSRRERRVGNIHFEEYW